MSNAATFNHGSFMQALKRARYAKGLSQQQVARMVGVRQSTVGSWEAGENLPRPKFIPKLARVLGVEPTELTKYIAPIEQPGQTA